MIVLLPDTEDHMIVSPISIHLDKTLERDDGQTAGLSIVPVVPWQGAPADRGPPISCQIFYTLF